MRKGREKDKKRMQIENRERQLSHDVSPIRRDISRVNKFQLFYWIAMTPRELFSRLHESRIIYIRKFDMHR